jgi:hypothetical protein
VLYLQLRIILIGNYIHDEFIRQTTTITQPRQRRLNELGKQCQILDGLINADETNGKTPTVTQDKIKSRESGIEPFKRMAAKLTTDRCTKLLTDVRLIELLVSSTKNSRPTIGSTSRRVIELRNLFFASGLIC